MLKNDYDNKYGFTIYHSLNDFIMDYKKYYCTKRKQKIDDILNPLLSWETFDEIFSDFIHKYLYIWKIGKNENVSLYKYDDNVVVYTKNNCFSYVWYE